MKLGRLQLNHLFIFLPLLLLTSLSYATMGDITVCFPFFLLLAFLMAAMIAQGKSPLVGFDISVTKPPAEIKSTSYHVKSYDSGGFDTVSKTRDIKGGGTHVTRGAGYVANKFAKLGGKITGKDWGKEGGFTDNMSKRGAVFAISGGAEGGGHVGNAIRDKKAAEQKAKESQSAKKTAMEQNKKSVRSLTQMLMKGTGFATAYALSDSDAKKLKELQDKKKSGKKLSNNEKDKLHELVDKITTGTIKKMQQKADILEAKKKNGKLTSNEAWTLKSLRTELSALQNRQQEWDNNKKRYDLLSRTASDHAKALAALNVREKALKKEIEALDSIGGFGGRARIAASPFLFAAAGTGLAARSTYRSLFRVRKKDMKKLKQEYDANKGKGGKKIETEMTKTESKRLKSLRNKVDAGKPLKDTERKELAQLDMRERYLDLKSGRGTLSAIFNPDKIGKWEYFKKSVKGTAYGVGMAAWDSPALRTGRWLHKKYEGRPGVLGGENKRIKRLNNASKTLDEIDKLRNDLKKPIGDAERSQKLKEMDKLLGRFEKQLRKEIPGVTHLPKDIIKQVNSGSKHVTDAITSIQKARDDLSNSYLQMAALATALNLPKGSAARSEAEIKRDTLNTQIDEQTKKLKEKTNAMKKLIYETYMIRKDIKSHAAEGKLGWKQAVMSRTVSKKIAGKASRFYEVGTPETTRTAALGYARLRDFYTSESGSGGSRLGGLLKRSFAPFADTQKLKGIEDNMENVQNPTLIKINELKYEQLRITSQLEGGGKYLGLSGRVAKLNADIKNLEGEINSIKNVPQNKERIKQLRDMLGKKRTELIKLNKFMKDKEEQLERVRNNLNLLLNSFLYQDALSLQSELARKREENVKGVKEINRELYNDNAEMANLEKRMKDMKSSKGVSSKEYQDLSRDSSKLQKSINEKVETRKMLLAGSDKETSELRDQLREASALTKRAMGKEEVVYSDWLREKMEKQGSPQIGGESGLHREYYELSKLLEMSRDKNALKKAKETRFDKDMVKYIQGRLVFLNSQMYMNEMEMGQSITFEKAREYDKKFDAAEAKNKVLNASLETRMRQMMIDFDKSELKQDKDLGWTAEANRLEGFIKENKKKMDQTSELSSSYFELTDLKEKHQLAYATGDYGETWKLEEQIKALQEDLQKKTGVSFTGNYKEDFKDLFKTEKDSNEIALMNRWAKLIMLNNSIDRSIAGEQELAEHRKDAKQRLVRARDVAWAKFRFKKRPEVMSRENIVDSLMSFEVKDELKAFKKLFPKKSAMQQGAYTIAREAERRAEITDLPKEFLNESQLQLKSYEDAVKKASKRIKTLEEKKLQYSENQLEYKKIEDQQKEWQGKFRSRYAELKQYRNEFNSLFNPDREKELLQPGAEKKIREHTAEREEEIRNEHLYGGSSSRISGAVSKSAARLNEFLFRHGGKALGATAVAAPLLLPFIGPGAVVLSATAAGGYGLKKLIQERNKPQEYGYPLETGFDAVARDALHGQHLSSHFTGRGSGAPPTTWGKAWTSQMTGAEYITRGFYVDRYGDTQPNKENLSVYTEGAPWFIKAFVAPVMPTASTLSSNIRKFTLKMQYHEESKNLAQYIKESPRRIPEAKEGINPQYVKLYGAMENIIHPKAAQEMYNFNIFTPYQEQAKNIVVVRKFSSGTALMEGPRGKQTRLREREERMHNLGAISLDRVESAMFYKKRALDKDSDAYNRLFRRY